MSQKKLIECVVDLLDIVAEDLEKNIPRSRQACPAETDKMRCRDVRGRLSTLELALAMEAGKPLKLSLDKVRQDVGNAVDAVISAARGYATFKDSLGESDSVIADKSFIDFVATVKGKLDSEDPRVQALVKQFLEGL